MEHIGPQSRWHARVRSAWTPRGTALSAFGLAFAVLCGSAAGCTEKKGGKADGQVMRNDRDAGANKPDADSTSDNDADMDPVGNADSGADALVPSPVLGACENVTLETCPESGCASGSICVPGVCGGSVCQTGRVCADDDDCGAGGCEQATGHCKPSPNACSNSRDCALGFECESATCVDRRITCWAKQRSGCPLGYYCDTPQSPGFCVRILEPCERSSQCPFAGTCIDVDGDDQSECVSSGPCARGKTCDEGLGCGFDPAMGGKESDCTIHFLCHLDQDCGGEAPTCLDGAGDGQGLCAPGAGTCSTNEDCASPAICAMEFPGAAPTCLGGSSEL